MTQHTIESPTETRSEAPSTVQTAWSVDYDPHEASHGAYWDQHAAKQAAEASWRAFRTQDGERIEFEWSELGYAQHLAFRQPGDETWYETGLAVRPFQIHAAAETPTLRPDFEAEVYPRGYEPEFDPADREERLAAIELRLSHAHPAPWVLIPRQCPDHGEHVDIWGGDPDGPDAGYYGMDEVTTHEYSRYCDGVPLSREDGDLIANAPEDLAWLMQQVRDLRSALAELADLVGQCPPPDIASGYDLCPCADGSAWPCAKTAAVWRARGLDPKAEVRKAIHSAMAELAAEFGQEA